MTELVMMPELLDITNGGTERATVDAGGETIRVEDENAGEETAALV